MSKLTFTMDTDLIDYENGMTFEDMVSKTIQESVLKDAVTKMSKERLDRVTNQLCQSAEKLIEGKLKALLNEDLVLNDKWGKPLFIGSIEDYIKKTIDDKTIGQVDSKGKKITGCTTTDHTWIQWMVEKELTSALSKMQDNIRSLAQDWLKNELRQAIESFKTHTLKQAITDHLESIGIK